MALIGDAAHAMVPFYGQGLNCSFEDCLILSKLTKLHHNDWTKILPDYYLHQKENADAISKLSKDYFFEISSTHDSSYKLLSKKITDKFTLKNPKLWPELDQTICFSPEISYARAREISLKQKEIMTEIMQIPNIQQCWQEDFVTQKLEELALLRLAPLLE